MTAVVHFTVTRMPLDPYTWYEENKTELKDGYHPAELHSVECSFESEEDAKGYCDAKNVELYVDTFWKTKLSEEEQESVETHVDKVWAKAVRKAERAKRPAPSPILARHTFLRTASALLQTKLTVDITDAVDGMPGGYSYCSMEHYARD